jgi:hypothetical protein
LTSSIVLLRHAASVSGATDGLATDIPAGDGRRG